MRALFQTATPKFLWLLSAFVGIPAIYDIVTGTARGQLVDVVHGFSGLVMVAFLAYSAQQIQRGNSAVLSTPRVRIAGYACLALFAAGFLFKLGMTAQRVFG